MKKLAFSIITFVLLSANTLSAVKYVDAKDLTLINRADTSLRTFSRLDTTLYQDLNATAKRHYTCSTGLAIVFRTNSKNITAKWNVAYEPKSLNTTPIMQSGLDLYIYNSNSKNWVFAGIGSPRGKNKQYSSPIVENMSGEYHDCLLYLPIWDKVNDLQIGIDDNAEIIANENPFKNRIIVIGSSITHGSSASRPGLTYPARMERETGLEFINLGCSGECKLDEAFARMVVNYDADAYIFDTFSNPTAEQIHSRMKKFVDIIRDKRPNVPLIFLQTEIRETGNYDLKKREFEYNKRNAAKEEYSKLKNSGYKNIYFIDPAFNIGDNHENTVDGTHPSDAGFDLITNSLRPKIMKILKRYKIESK